MRKKVIVSPKLKQTENEIKSTEDLINETQKLIEKETPSPSSVAKETGTGVELSTPVPNSIQAIRAKIFELKEKLIENKGETLNLQKKNQDIIYLQRCLNELISKNSKQAQKFEEEVLKEQGLFNPAVAAEFNAINAQEATQVTQIKQVTPVPQNTRRFSNAVTSSSGAQATDEQRNEAAKKIQAIIRAKNLRKELNSKNEQTGNKPNITISTGFKAVNYDETIKAIQQQTDSESKKMVLGHNDKIQKLNSEIEDDNASIQQLIKNMERDLKEKQQQLKNDIALKTAKITDKAEIERIKIKLRGEAERAAREFEANVQKNIQIIENKKIEKENQLKFEQEKLARSIEKNKIYIQSVIDRENYDQGKLNKKQEEQLRLKQLENEENIKRIAQENEDRRNKEETERVVQENKIKLAGKIWKRTAIKTSAEKLKIAKVELVELPARLSKLGITYINEYLQYVDRFFLIDPDKYVSYLDKYEQLHLLDVLVSLLEPYNQQLKTTSLLYLTTTLSKILINEINNDKKIIQEKAQISQEAEITIRNYIAKLSLGFRMDQKNDNPENTQKLSYVTKIVNEYYDVKDTLFPVRLVMNFGIFQQPTSVIKSDKIISNYNKSRISTEPKYINNLLDGEQTIVRDTMGVEKSRLNEPKYGPYYLVTTTTGNNYNVRGDVNKLFTSTIKGEVTHIVYSAYGASGSGKTFTLLNQSGPNDNSVLKKILDTVKLRKNTRVEYRISDYYGEIKTGDERGCVVDLGSLKDPIGDRCEVYFYKNGKDTQDPSFTKIDDLKRSDKIILDDYGKFQYLRQSNIAKNGERTILRVRSTPNNKESSRGPAFLDLDIYETITGKDEKGEEVTYEEKKGRVTILDMAGNEDVDIIQKSYFDNVKTDFDTTDFASFVKENVLESLQNLTKLKIGWGDTGVKTRVEEDTFLLKFKVDIPSIKEGSKSNGTFIIRDPWNNVLKEFNQNAKQTGFTDGAKMKMFVDNYNFYNYVLLIKDIYDIRTVLYSLFKSCLTRNAVGYFLDISQFNVVLTQVGLEPLNEDYIDLLKFFTDRITDKNALQNPLRWIGGNNANTGEQIVNSLLRTLSSVLKKMTTVINSNTNYQSLMLRYSEDLKNQGRKISEIGDLDKETCKQLILEWNKKYINDMHCSLRYQGNFIMKTLTDMRYYICRLQNDPMNPLKDYFPGNILHLDDGVSGKTTKVKFILFTNIRLDFDPSLTEANFKPDSSDPTKFSRNNNLREAYINSVKFSNSINPFIKQENTAGCKQPTSPTPTPQWFINVMKARSRFGKKQRGLQFGQKHKVSKRVKQLKRNLKTLKRLHFKK